MQLRHARTNPCADLWVAQICSSESARIEVFFYASILKSAIHPRTNVVLRGQRVKDV